MAQAARPSKRGLRYRPVAVMLLSLVTLTLYIWPKYIAVGAGLKISPFNLSVLAGLTIGILGLFVKATRPKLTVFGALAIISFLIHYISRFFSDFSSGNANSSVYEDLRGFIWGGSLFIVGLLLGHWPGILERVARIVCISSILILITATIEIVTSATFSSILLSYLPIPIDESFRSMLVFDKTRDGMFRAQSVFLHPIVMGEVAAASLPVAIALLLGRTRFWLPFLAIVACVVTGLLSGSRAAQIGLLVGCLSYGGLALLVSRSAAMWGVALVTLPLSAGAVLIGSNYAIELAEGRTEAEQLSTEVREAQWRRGLSAFENAPLIGYGAGNSVRIAGVMGRLQSLTIDDWYLTLLLDYGIIGMTTYILIIFFTGIGCVISRVSVADRRFHAGLLAGVLVILICQRALSIGEAISFQMLFAGLLVANMAHRTRFT